MIKDNELLPCPFCGSVPAYGWRNDAAAIFRPDKKSIFCHCGFDSSHARKYDGDAITWWNTRAKSDDPQWDGTDYAHPAWWRGHDYMAMHYKELKEKYDTLIVKPPTAAPVDIEQLKRELPVEFIGAFHNKQNPDYHEAFGWNAAIDHLTAQGFLNGKAVPMDTPDPADRSQDVEHVKDGD